MKLCLVCSSGGHLLLLHRLHDFWSHHQRVWVTFAKPDAEALLPGETVYSAHFPTNRHIPNLLRNTMLAWRVLRREKPDLILSSGAGVALPFFLLGRLLGKKLVFIEAYERIDSPSLTGRLVYPLCHAFILQWEEQRAFYPKGILLGPLL